MRLERTRLVGLLLSLALAAQALHLAGRVGELAWPRGEIVAWAVTAPFEEVAGVALRAVALAGVYWLLGTTVLYALARALGAARIARAAGWAALPAARRLADRAIGLTLMGSVLGSGPAALAPAFAATPPAPLVAAAGYAVSTQPTSADDHVPGPLDPSVATLPLELPGAPAAPGGEADHVPASPPAPPATAEPAPPAPGQGQPTEGQDLPRSLHRVVAGDHLWGLAQARVGQATGRDRSDLRDREVHAYWVEVVAANAGRLPSGDPDLLFPGDEAVLPPLSAPLAVPRPALITVETPQGGLVP